MSGSAGTDRSSTIRGLDSTKLGAMTAITNDVPVEIMVGIVDEYLTLFELVQLASTCRDMKKLVDEKLQQWDAHYIFERIPANIPTGTSVRIHGGENDGRTGSVAKPFGDDCNTASRAFLSVGLQTPKDLPKRYAVIEMHGEEKEAVLVPYTRLEILNRELYDYFKRAACFGDLSAMRVLGHCLVEGQGGLPQCLNEGPYWSGFAAGAGDTYSTKWGAFVRGFGSEPVFPPPFETLLEAEMWQGWET